MRKKGRAKFNPDALVPVNRYMTLKASEIVKAHLEVRPRQVTVYDVVDVTTGKIWSPKFDTQSDATLAMETINAESVRHYKTLLDVDNENEQDRKERLRDLVKQAFK